MTIDKYTKFILTLIAVGVIGINFHLYSGSIMKDAYAASHVQKVQICDKYGKTCLDVSKTRGITVDQY